MLHVRALAWLSLLIAACCGCTRQANPPAPPAEKPHTESDLARTTLSKEAAKSLQVRTQRLKPREVLAHRKLTGWVVPRPGHEVTLTAPLAGIIHQVKSFPAPGLPVEDGNVLLSLTPVLTPLDMIQLASLKRGVESELAKARESAAVAESEFKRVQDLFKQKLRGDQELETAQAKLKHAKEDLDAARDKLKLFPVNPEQKDLAHLAPLQIKAPLSGTILAVHVGPGRYVAAAEPLMLIADLSEPWLRVPVPEHDLQRIDRATPATIAFASLDPKQPLKTLTAKAVALVPQVDPQRHTADVLYQLQPAQGLILAKDQMLTVDVPLLSKAKESLVPYAAVVFDAYSGAWIYLDRSPKDANERVYERRRVELGPSFGDDIAIRPPPAPEDEVVVHGAAALFSREFYKPPVAQGKKTEVEDDD